MEPDRTIPPPVGSAKDFGSNNSCGNRMSNTPKRSQIRRRAHYLECGEINLLTIENLKGVRWEPKVEMSVWV